MMEKENSIKKLEMILERINQTILLIEAGKEKEAREYFIEKLFNEYHKVLSMDNSPFMYIFPFYYDLNEYLNNESAKTIGMSIKENVIGS